MLGRLESEAGVDIEGLDLDDLQAVTTRVLEYVSSFPLEPRTPQDPTLVAANERQRDALLAAAAPFTEGWSEADRTVAAAMLDALWSVTTYERLVAGWELDPKAAIRGVTWVIGLVEDAIRSGRRPS